MNQKTQKMVLVAVMAALTYVATALIKIPTPTMGYIHLGNCVVLLCGYLLGPWLGALAAGTGSMFADILSPYIVYAPATFLIKGINACVASLVLTALRKRKNGKESKIPFVFALIISGVLAESLMVLGYFGYDILVSVAFNFNATNMTLAAGITYALTSVPFYVLEAIVSIIIVTILYPLLKKILSKSEF